MIHDRLPGLPRLDARRAIGLLLVVVLVVLAFAGALHTADRGHSGHPCSVCDAALATAGATIPLPAIRFRLPEAREHAPPRAEAVLLSFDAARIHAPRGPPVRA